MKNNQNPQNKEKENGMYAKVRNNTYNAVNSYQNIEINESDGDSRFYLSYSTVDKFVDADKEVLAITARGMIAKGYRKSNNKGWVIYFDLLMKKEDKVPAFISDISARLTINETPSGVKFLWFVKGKPQWGMSFSGGASKYLYQGHEFIKLLRTKIESMYSLHEFIPIAKYLLPSPMPTTFFDIHNVPTPWFNKLSGGTNPREILNKAYGKSGQHGLSRNAFGGIANIKYLTQLGIAYELVSILKSMPAHFFERICMDEQTCGFVTDTYFGKEELRYFFKYFNHKKIQDDLVQSINYSLAYYGSHEVEEENVYFLSSAVFLYNEELNLVKDAGRMLKEIKNRTVRKNILGFKGNIRETHDLIVIEYNKVKQADRKIKYYPDEDRFHNKNVNENIISVLPQSTHELIEWGATQHNCMGSYGERIANGIVRQSRTLIVGFKNKLTNKWIGHARIERANGLMCIAELRGDYNQSVEPVEGTIITEFLNSMIDDLNPPF